MTLSMETTFIETTLFGRQTDREKEGEREKAGWCMGYQAGARRD